MGALIFGLLCLAMDEILKKIQEYHENDGKYFGGDNIKEKVKKVYEIIKNTEHKRHMPPSPILNKNV